MKKGFDPVLRRDWGNLNAAEEEGYGGYAVRGFESFVALVEVQLVTRLFEDRGLLYRKVRKGERSSCRLMTRVALTLVDGCCEILGVEENLDGDIDPVRNHLGREKSQGQSGTRVVATAPGDRNCGYWADMDGLGHDLCFCLDRGLTLALSVSPCHGDHGLGQHSTGLSTPDSYGAPPCKRRQRHLVQSGK
ncbi:hypothetical protein N7463_001763 [Penicillium fimorum]|uniref:Uncharacterized protein n=1 Tax=Penicillium fimorum TaxID=1882269 RepID=A0A9X0C7V9_9EURO|nr:hypothetical protein N7463_001763 [Penicillium fimorum]